jgi:uncharacterized damage-inducible protein DinB
METEVLKEFKKHSIFRLKEGLRMVQKAMELVSDDQLWKLPVEGGMTLGNQLLHCSGNMRQYIIASLGKQADSRKRDEEFKINQQLKKKALIVQLNKTVESSIQIIENTGIEEYLKIRKVQGFSFSGLGAVLHAVEHFSYHVGQLAFWVKFLTHQDLGFYEGIDLTENNENNAN